MNEMLIDPSEGEIHKEEIEQKEENVTTKEAPSINELERTARAVQGVEVKETQDFKRSFDEIFNKIDKHEDKVKRIARKEALRVQLEKAFASAAKEEIPENTAEQALTNLKRNYTTIVLLMKLSAENAARFYREFDETQDNKNATTEEKQKVKSDWEVSTIVLSSMNELRGQYHTLLAKERIAKGESPSGDLLTLENAEKIYKSNYYRNQDTIDSMDVAKKELQLTGKEKLRDIIEMLKGKNEEFAKRMQTEFDRKGLDELAERYSRIGISDDPHEIGRELTRAMSGNTQVGELATALEDLLIQLNILTHKDIDQRNTLEREMRKVQNSNDEGDRRLYAYLVKERQEFIPNRLKLLADTFQVEVSQDDVAAVKGDAAISNQTIEKLIGRILDREIQKRPHELSRAA